MVRVARGQVVRVIAISGGGEWWYVEDRHQQRGYVPAAYLKPYYDAPQHWAALVSLSHHLCCDLFVENAHFKWQFTIQML